MSPSGGSGPCTEYRTSNHMISFWPVRETSCDVGASPCLTCLNTKALTKQCESLIPCSHCVIGELTLF